MQLYSFEDNEQPSSLGHNLQGIQHFGFTTPDLAKSLKFYIDILGGRLAVGGDGFYGDELHNLLFQADEMKAKEEGISAEDAGIPDIRDGTKEVLDVRFIEFGNASLEMLHFRGANSDASAPNTFKPIRTSVGFGNGSHLSFFLKSDIDVNKFATELEDTCHNEGLTEVQVHRKVDVGSRAELASSSKTFAIDQFPGSFDGWCLIYVKGPNGEQLEFNQVKTTCKDNFISAQQLYNRLAGSSYQWPSN
jgi:catechol 2,3-dioxygenase-like lactoylglutathione lyase family enzyme